jgi:SAM-dependent methyltransferase
MREWVAFWNSDHSIYVNARHRDVHYQLIADDIRTYVPRPDATVLDYGCGEALHADRVTANVGRLILCDAAPNVRAALAQRFAAQPRIEVRSPEEVAALPGASIDLIVMVSVAQYLTPMQLDELLATFLRLLKPDGRLVLGDVISTDSSPMKDVVALLRFAAARGFLGAALIGLARSALSTYAKLRTRVGLTRYDEPAMLRTLRAAGFAGRRAPRNFGHDRTRMTFTATPAAQEGGN